jgi:small GTP-binding protein
MLLRFADNTFNENYLCTIGVDFKIKTLRVDGQQMVKLQLWDTAGQERFRSISQAYYRNSHGCIAVYDITNRNSFHELRGQIENFISYSSKEVASNIILVGNKSDLSKSRQVELSDA